VSKICLALQAGEEVDAKDALNVRNVTGLMYASENGHEGAVRALLEAGAAVDSKDTAWSTALMWASKDGHEGTVRVLIEAGAALDSKDMRHFTALMWASGNGHEGAVRVLLEAGAAVDSKSENQSTTLMYASSQGHEGAVLALLEAGAAVDSKNNDWSTALMWASESGHEGTMRVLLEARAAVDSKDNVGSTALVFASENGRAGAVRVLIEAGAAEPAAGLVTDREDDVCDAMEDGRGPLFGVAHTAAGWPSDATRALAAVVHGLSIASKRNQRPLPEALVQMEALLGAAAGGEEAMAQPATVVAGTASPRPLVSSSRGASMPPVREDEPDARAVQPEVWSGGELTRMVRKLELGDADAPLARKRERVTKAYDSMMVRLERAYAGQGHAPLPTDEQELRKIDLLAPRHLGRLNGLAHTLRKWWNSAKHERDQWAHPPSDKEVQRLVRDVIVELDGLGW